MLLEDVNSAGSLPVLEAMMRFAAQRQKLLVHNVANLTTPEFEAMDVSVSDFQRTLASAIERRRAETGGQRGSLSLQGNDEVVETGGGAFVLRPQTPAEGIRFKDGASRSLEKQMQALAENASVFRAASDLWRQQHDLIRSAIAQRV
jgi:flagellar basal body rod protein FlgB